MDSNWKEGIECSRIAGAHWAMIPFQRTLSWKDYLAKFGQTLDGIYSMGECWAVSSAHTTVKVMHHNSMLFGDLSWKDYLITFDKKLEYKLTYVQGKLNGKSFI